MSAKKKAVPAPASKPKVNAAPSSAVEKKGGVKPSRPAPAPAFKPSTNSALSIVIPVDLADEIQTLRLKYDKAVGRWPPHINLLWPFVLETELDQARLLLIFPLFVIIRFQT